jgi:hypothetical protein
MMVIKPKQRYTTAVITIALISIVISQALQLMPMPNKRNRRRIHVIIFQIVAQ